jgi:transposase
MDNAGQLLVTAGDNLERLKSEAAFAHLGGVAPIPANRGADRHRLNRGGDRQANKALWHIVMVRMQWHARTRGPASRARHQHRLSEPKVMHRLKRYVARDVSRHITSRGVSVQR